MSYCENHHDLGRGHGEQDVLTVEYEAIEFAVRWLLSGHLYTEGMIQATVQMVQSSWKGRNLGKR